MDELIGCWVESRRNSMWGCLRLQINITRTYESSDIGIIIIVMIYNYWRAGEATESDYASGPKPPIHSKYYNGTHYPLG